MADIFCAEASTAANEDLAGSAPADTDVWVVLEHDDVWAKKPLEGRLPAGVKAHLEGWLRDVPGSRLQLIRRPRPRRAEGEPLHLYVGRSSEREPWLVALALDRIEDVMGIDLSSTLARRGHPHGHNVRGPLYLVCTHGRRDRCCAKWGMPMFEALAALGPEEVWQTTHTGGHRFAANVLVLPHGVLYGRLTPADAPALVRAHQEGRLYDLGRLRGRTCYDAVTQAAEVAVREAQGLQGLEALEHLHTTGEGESTWLVRFRDEAGTTMAAVRLCREATGRDRPPSCGESPEGAYRYRRV